MRPTKCHRCSATCSRSSTTTAPCWREPPLSCLSCLSCLPCTAVRAPSRAPNGAWLCCAAERLVRVRCLRFPWTARCFSFEVRASLLAGDLAHWPRPRFLRCRLVTDRWSFQPAGCVVPFPRRVSPRLGARRRRASLTPRPSRSAAGPPWSPHTPACLLRVASRFALRTPARGCDNHCSRRSCAVSASRLPSLRGGVARVSCGHRLVARADLAAAALPPSLASPPLCRVASQILGSSARSVPSCRRRLLPFLSPAIRPQALPLSSLGLSGQPFHVGVGLLLLPPLPVGVAVAGHECAHSAHRPPPRRPCTAFEVRSAVSSNSSCEFESL